MILNSRRVKGVKKKLISFDLLTTFDFINFFSKKIYFLAITHLSWLVLFYLLEKKNNKDNNNNNNNDDIT
jgi:hypothetical protein